LKSFEQSGSKIRRIKMKKTLILLLSFFLIILALTVAHTSRSVSAAANIQAQSIRRTNVRSNKGQQLRRYDPQMQSTEQDFGPDKLSVGFEKSIPLSTRQALISYVTQHYKIAQLIIAIYKLPNANNLYFVIGTVSQSEQSQETEKNIFLILRGQGETVSEVSKAENGNTCGIKEPVFFLGQNKLLIVVSIMAFDGGFCGNDVFEYADNNLKSIGGIDVYDGRHGRGGWQGESPMGRATAEYKNNTYYVTMRGVGSLYGYTGDKDKKIAPPGSPITFFYNGADWRPVATRQIRRS
jgi:type III secretory pathway component EscS